MGQKLLVDGHDYRFQVAHDLQKCLTFRRNINSAFINDCSISGPREFFLRAHPAPSMIPNQFILRFHTRDETMVTGLGDNRQDQCLSTNGHAGWIEDCNAESSMQRWSIEYRSGKGQHPVPGSYLLKANGRCFTDDGLHECPLEDSGRPGHWIVTEAPSYQLPAEDFQLISEYRKEMSCVLGYGAQYHGLVKSYKDGCKHDQPEQLFTAERVGSNLVRLVSKLWNTPLGLTHIHHRALLKWDLSFPENAYRGYFYSAQWFDGSYQFISSNYREGWPKLAVKWPHANHLELIPGEFAQYAQLGNVGARRVGPNDYKDSHKSKTTQVHLKIPLEPGRHINVDDCDKDELRRLEMGHYDSTDDCEVRRRVDAMDDPHIATVETGAVVDIDVLRNDSHVNAGPLEITDISVSRGTASINKDGTIRFQAPSDYSGTVSISYSIADGLPEMSDMPHGSDSAVATVNVWENVSLNKPATQSSNWGNHPASLAVDGYLNNYTHTTLESEAWWKVSLEGVHRVKEVNVFNRTDCCKDRLKDFKIILHHANGVLTRFNPNKGYDEERVEDVYSFKFFQDAFTDIVAVTVQLEGTNYLSLADVQVLGEKLGPLPPVSKQTNPSSGGGGDMVYLDRHQLSCEPRGISQFQLKRQGADEIYYGYECSQMASNDLSGTYQSTTFSSDGGGNTRYLDRHALNCNDRPIHAFELKRNNKHNKVRYRYRCGSQKLFNVKTYHTPWDEASEKSWYLDRHNVECPSNQVLSFVRLITQWENNRMRYRFKCGSPFE